MSGTGLLTYASPWNNESNNRNNNTVRKRQSTLPNPCMRNNKTIKKNPTLEDVEEYPVDSDNIQSLSPATLDDSNARSTKIQEIINNVGSVKTEDDGTTLANFNPNTNLEKPTAKPIASFYATNDSTSFTSGDYKDIYNSASRIGDYVYPKPVNVTPVVPVMHDKFAEKINYMIHLLEEQQKEPTKHITEEFILYTFLGIFVIYIVDSFARVGKYIR
jgi:hypothetical protein